MTLVRATAGAAAVHVDWPNVWAIVGVLVALAAIVVGALASRRWGNRRTLLRVAYRVRPVRPFGLRSDEGVQIVEPNPPVQFDVELRLTNRGPQDIVPEHFGGRELRFGFAPATLRPGRLSNNLDSGLLVFDGQQACLRPTRIAVGKSLYFMVRATDARPDLWVGTPLVNVRVRRRRYRDLDADPLGQFTLSGANGWLRSRVLDL